MTKNIKQLECDAVLFDLDGVLIDSTSCIVRHWKAWAGQHSLDLNEIMQAAHGIRTIETMRLVAPHLDVEKEAEQFTAREILDTAGVVAIEGSRHILEALAHDTWAIVTSASSELARARLVQTNLPVPKILVTADDVKRGKPAPEPYLIGAKRLGIAVERCIVIEDAPAGIKAGKRAGMRVIATSATHTREELLEHGADIVVDQLSNLQIKETVGEYRLAIRVKRDSLV